MLTFVEHPTFTKQAQELFEAEEYGTARHRYRMCSCPQQAYLPGFAP